MTLTANSLLVGTFDCNDGVHTLLTSIELALPGRAYDSSGAPGLAVARVGAIDRSALVTSKFTVRITGDTAADMWTRINALRAQIPGATDDVTEADALLGVAGAASTVTLKLRVSDAPVVPVTPELLSYKVAKVELTLTHAPYLLAPTQTILGSIADAPLGSAWPVDWTQATYTAGKGVISLRFDDGTDDDYDYTLPQLESRGLIAGFAVCPGRIGDSGFMTAAQIARVENAGNELMCHSYDHSTDPTSLTEFKYQTKGALDALRALGHNVGTFVQPGTWPNLYDIDPTNWVMGSAADLYLREHFLAYEGYLWTSQRTLPITGEYRYGPTHSSPDGFDTGTYKAKTYIDLAITNGTGFELLFHSASIGGAGISTAQFEATLDYLVTKIAAGDITLLTPTQQLFAVAA